MKCAADLAHPHLPPDHLLRNVFETCKTFREARQRLETTPVARPVIYTLVGCERGERCVIERTEEAYAVATTTPRRPTTAARPRALGGAHAERRRAHPQL